MSLLADRLYLDHAATTPVLPEARAAMTDAMAHWANPSSPHAEGRAARAALEDARRRIAAALGWDGHVILTSGASEAIAIALGRAQRVRVVTSPVEHDAVLRVTKSAQRLAVDAEGEVTSLIPPSRHSGEGRNPVPTISSATPPEVDSRLRGNDGCGETESRTLFAIQQANNETGVIQPLDHLGAEIAAHGDLLFADCSQSAGKLPLPQADMICVSAHKLGGPPGIGALLIRDLTLIAPSGGQEQGYRMGTENLPAALGFAAALEAPRDWIKAAATLRVELDAAIAAAGGEVVAAGADRLPTIGSYRMPGVPASAQLIRFDMAGIAVSAGSACSSGTLKASHVLKAMGWDDAAAGEVVRVSFGPQTTVDDVARFLTAWRAIAGKGG